MNYSGEMGSVCIPSFVKTGSSIQKFIQGYTYTQTPTRRQQDDLICLGK
jgi:hypothetical protein